MRFPGPENHQGVPSLKKTTYTGMDIRYLKREEKIT